MKVVSQPVSQRRAEGFTILEVVFSMGILLMGLSVVLGLLSFGASVGTTAIRRAEAAGALEFVVADLEERMFPVLPDGSIGDPVAISAAAVPGHDRLVYSATPVPDPNAASTDGGTPWPPLFRIDVEISWQQSGLGKTLKFSTLMPRQVPFGERLRQLSRASQ